MNEHDDARATGATLSSPKHLPALQYSSDASLGATLSTPKNVDILIVEDDFLIAFDLEAALEEAGFVVVGVAASAEEALALACKHSPSVVIMDVRLVGGRDGIDAALELYSRYGLRCIFASAHSDEETRKRAEPAQPLGWIEKPYSVRTVIEFVHDLTSKRS
jgi:DNA-binding NarL/FixJ family response regulator